MTMYDDDPAPFLEWHQRRYKKARNKIGRPEKADDMVMRLMALLLAFGASSMPTALALAYQVVADDILYLEGDHDPVELGGPFDQDVDL